MNGFNQIINSEGMAIITIDRPPVNALNRQLLTGLTALVSEAGADTKIRSIIVTGSDKLFAAGADIKEMSTLSTPGEVLSFLQAGHDLCNALEQSDVPVIAAINGVCFGGGLEIALGCHIRVADKVVRFAFPEVSLGIMPGFGGTQRMSRLIGTNRTIELVLTSGTIDAQTAYEYGLINHITAKGKALDAAKKIAYNIVNKGKPAVQAALASIRDGIDMPLSKGLQLEIDNFLPLCETDNMKEGIRAFIEKRQPVPLDE